MPLIVLVLVSCVSAVLIGYAAWHYPDVSPTGRPTLDLAVSAGHKVAEHRRLRAIIDARRHPGTATGLFLSIAALITMAGAAIVGALAYLVRRDTRLADIDSALSRWADRHDSAFTLNALDVVTTLGQTAVVIGLAAVVAFVETRRTRSVWIAPFLATVICGNILLYTTIKELADRARPALNPIAETLGPSYPSGHSATAAAFFAAIALLLGRRRSRPVRAALAGSAAGIAVAVGASRVMLDVHWLTDVVGGLALGWSWFAICAIAFGGRLLSFGATAKVAGEVMDETPVPQPADEESGAGSVPSG